MRIILFVVYHTLVPLFHLQSALAPTFEGFRNVAAGIVNVAKDYMLYMGNVCNLGCDPLIYTRAPHTSHIAVVVMATSKDNALKTICKIELPPSHRLRSSS